MTTQPDPQTQKQKLPIRTQHCRFCNHLLLATTRTLSALPRRGEGAQDKAIIIPLEDGDGNGDADGDAEAEAEAEAEIEEQNQQGTTATNAKSKAKSKRRMNHTTLLLSTTLPDRRPTLIRREDGIEKRILLRCGRCRVVVGYYLDKVHWDTTRKEKGKGTDGEKGEGEERPRPPAVYVLPGAVVETEKMGAEGGGVGEREWRGWDA